MSEGESYIKCPECGKDAFKLYDYEELEEKYGDNPMMLLDMKRYYQCSDKKECAYVFQVSMLDVTKAFLQKEKDEGKTTKQVLEMLRLKKSSIEKELEEKEKHK